MDMNYTLTPIVGPATYEYASDYQIDLQFLDSDTGRIVYEYHGLMTSLMSMLTSQQLAQFVGTAAPRMVAILGGLDG